MVPESVKFPDAVSNSVTAPVISTVATMGVSFTAVTLITILSVSERVPSLVVMLRVALPL